MSMKNFNLIKNRMSLRKPQSESLEILTKILDKIELKKENNNEELLSIIKASFPTCTDFERKFPSICFSLATGVGKTRLMGAFMAYLYKEKGIKNFMVIAPNLTIYNKLIKDFGDTSYSKYVFKGMHEFYSANIVTGDNYKKNIEGQLAYSDITINVFNISKINKETKAGKELQIKKLSEYIGDSYFKYLSKQEDLVILMDESHHYRAEAGMQVLNDLKPVLGLELTATPQVEKGSKTIKFKNVVYEYSLAKAMRDGFVKIPHVATKRNFNIDNYKTDIEKDIVKLEDGIRIHEDTKIALDIYSKDNDTYKVKPFVLVVAKDTNHAEELLKVIKSKNFFEGNYANKVIIVHSNQKGEEKDENIQELVSLEEPDNKTEIVIHVNMLKEGWDVNNLYTIIPLRASAASTLTEQTIGRGLRLPYGKLTGVEKVDSLTIVSHDKYKEIVEIANSEDSLIRKENIIVIEDEDYGDKKEVIIIQDNLSSEISAKKEEIQSILNWEQDNNLVKNYADLEAKEFVINTVFKQNDRFNGQVNNINDLKKDEVKQIVINKYKEKASSFPQITMEGFDDSIIKSIEQNFEAIIESVQENIIEIPRITIIRSPDSKIWFEDFDLDTSGLELRVTDQTILITDLTTNKTSEIKKTGKDYLEEGLENTIVSLLCHKPQIDYDNCSELLFKLATQAINKLKSYLKENEVITVVKDYKAQIAEYIYSQMKEHLKIQEGELIGKKVLPFIKIEKHNYSKIYQDDLYDYHKTIDAIDIKTKVFTGFKKACHSAYKFDSTSEKKFVICLEEDDNVVKWLRPAPKQFDILWNKQGNQYEPDFIVETKNEIYMVEVKKDKEIYTNEVQSKKEAGIKYCENATEYNLANGKKKWKYIIIPSSEVNIARRMDEYDNLFFNKF